MSPRMRSCRLRNRRHGVPRARRTRVVWCAVATSVLTAACRAPSKPEDGGQAAPDASATMAVATVPPASAATATSASGGPSGAEPPCVKVSAAVKDGPVARFRGVGVHHAVRLIAEIFRVNVVVAGGSDAPLALDVRADKAEQALTDLAAAAGLSVEKRSVGWVLAPKEALGNPPRSALAACPGADLDLVRADATQLLELATDVCARPIPHKVEGELTLRLRNVPIHLVATEAVRLAAPAGKLPAIRGPEPELGTPCSGPPLRLVKMHCEPPAELELVATFVGPSGKSLAMLRRGWAGVVRQGDFVGKAEMTKAADDAEVGISWQVTRIADRELTLSLARPESRPQDKPRKTRVLRLPPSCP